MHIPRTQIFLRLAAATLATGALVAFPAPAAADENVPIKIESSSIISEFPAGFRINLTATSEKPIKSVAVRVKVGLRTRGAYDYLCQDKPGAECGGESATLVGSEFFWRTNTSARYIPPGTIITYNFEVEDIEGNLLETDQELFIYEDARFDWEEVSEGPVAVAYHGPVKTRAELVRDAITETLGIMGPILGANTEEPIRVTMYNNVLEMLEALPPGSTTIRRELITEGQAFSDVGTLLVLGGGRQAEGTASHEVTHILVDRGGRSVLRRIPSWLNEGLAEFGNISPGFSYDIALEFAVATNRLQPIMFMEGLPGDPEDVIIFYGQARSTIRFMINEFGPSRMTRLMAELKDGMDMDDAMQSVYGMDRLAMDTLWRESVDAKPYVPPDVNQAVPTALPARTILPYSLTPQAQAEVIGSKSDEPTPTATPEPTPAPTPTAEPEPTPVPSPEPAAAAAPEPEEPSNGGTPSCNAVGDGSGPLDSALGLMALGFVGLVGRRRLRR